MSQTQLHTVHTRSTGAAALLALPLLAATAAPAFADCDANRPFEEGARCLFIGHSFFVPVATAFDGVAGQNDFPRHRMDTVFGSGPAGSPGSLWNNAQTRATAEAVLATGEVELFGLTYFPGSNSGFDQYAQWIDLALQYNPETRFLVGVPWAPAGPSLETDAFDSATEQFAFTSFTVVEQLRAAYPDERIEFIAYGKTAPIMKAMFEAGDLPDIVGLTPSPNEGVPPSAALFEDPILGHGGPMMVELAALSWMDVLYGAKVDTLAFTAYQSDIRSIVDATLDFSEQFQPMASPCCRVDLAAPLGTLDVFDILRFFEEFGAGNIVAADFTGDGSLDVFDILVYFDTFGAGC